MKTYSLLVWQMIPEETRLYLIPNDVAELYKEFLHKAHGKCINVDDMNDGLNFLNHALLNEKYGDNAKFSQYDMLFNEFLVTQDNPINLGTDEAITFVCISGFYL